MSFCNSGNADRCPGNISGNPMNGLCEKVCVQVRKVFDACISQTTLENLSVTLTDLSPASPAEPLTFVSGRSTSSRGVITALTVTPLTDRPGLSRVLATVSIPVSITYTDANGVEGTGTGSLSLTEDVVMCVPTGSVFPVELAATVNMASPNGVYVSGTTFSITACTTVVLKVLADAPTWICSCPLTATARSRPARSFRRKCAKACSTCPSSRAEEEGKKNAERLLRFFRIPEKGCSPPRTKGTRPPPSPSDAF